MTAKLGSISKAAKELYTSQPAISQSIKQLEDKLGGILFFRSAKGVSLTNEGRVLFQYIEQGYNMMETAERKYRELRMLEGGQIRISACSEVCKSKLLEPICEFTKLYPNIKLQIKDESSSEIVRKLNLGEIDLGIFNLYQTDESNIEIIDTIELQDCFVVGEKYKELSRKTIDLQSIIGNYPIIMLQKGGNTRAYLDEYFRTKGIDISPQIELSNMNIMVEFAINGLGLACVTKEYVGTQLQNEELYEVLLEDKIEPRVLGVGIKKGMPLSAATESFLQLLGKNSKSLSSVRK